MKKTDFDVICIGGGPAGSIGASFLAMGGARVAIIERDAFPRFHIGESLLPASMPIYKEIGFFPKLAQGKYIEKFGARFVDYQTDDEIYFGFEGGLNREIPMAFEVPRADFDQDLLAHAVSLGAKLFQPMRVKNVKEEPDHIVVETQQGEMTCKYLLDTTGRDAFFGRKAGLRHPNRDLNNVAVFAHFVDVGRYSGKNEGDITIGLLPEGAWTWIIPFKGDRTSVGVVCSSSVFIEAQAKTGRAQDLAAYLEETISASPRCRALMQPALRVTEVTTISNYSHHSESFYGPRWICAGDAAAFLDPIFSSGVHIAGHSSRAAANTILNALNKGELLNAEGYGPAYQAHVQKGIDRFHSLISLFYEGSFVRQMKKTLTLPRMREAFTSAVAGDMWNDGNFLFEKGVL